VPKPTEGILAPVLSSKNGIALAISNKNQHTVLNLDSLLFIHEIHIRWTWTHINKIIGIKNLLRNLESRSLNFMTYVMIFAYGFWKRWRVRKAINRWHMFSRHECAAREMWHLQ
jgi:hypothetical protein